MGQAARRQNLRHHHQRLRRRLSSRRPDPSQRLSRLQPPRALSRRQGDRLSLAGLARIRLRSAMVEMRMVGKGVRFHLQIADWLVSSRPSALNSDPVHPTHAIAADERKIAGGCPFPGRAVSPTLRPDFGRPAATTAPQRPHPAKRRTTQKERRMSFSTGAPTPIE